MKNAVNLGSLEDPIAVCPRACDLPIRPLTD